MSPKEPLTISCRVIGGPCDGRLITVEARPYYPLPEEVYLMPPPPPLSSLPLAADGAQLDRVLRHAIHKWNFVRFTYVFEGMSE